MSFPLFPWHHGGVPDVNDTPSVDKWISQNINWKIKSDHHLTVNNIIDWIPNEYQPNKKYVKTIMQAIVHNEICGNHYMDSITLKVKKFDVDFQLEFIEEDFVDNNDPLLREEIFSDVLERQFQQNKELSVYDHNIANFDENVAKILVMIQTSTVQNIVGFYKDQQITHLISITNMIGPSLFDKMYNKRRKNYNKVSPTHTVCMLKNMIDSIYHLHSKFLVHTNINPSQFHFQRKNKLDLVLIGLESCKVMLPFDTLNDNGDFSKFNVKYLCPARVRQGDSHGVGNYTDLTDIWAVGIIAIELLCGISAYGKNSTNEEILEKIRGNKFPEIPNLEQHDLDDFLEGILCAETSRYTTAECQEHIIFDVKRVANLDVPSFLLNALTCDYIDQCKGIIRYGVATRVKYLSLDVMRQMASFFGVRHERKISLDFLKELLHDHGDDNQSENINLEVEGKLKKTMRVFQKGGDFTVFNILECVCFSQCTHMNRLKFFNDLLSDFEDSIITKKQLTEWFKIEEKKIPAPVQESILKSMNFDTITKTNCLSICAEFLKTIVMIISNHDHHESDATNRAFKIASDHKSAESLLDTIEVTFHETHEKVSNEKLKGDQITCFKNITVETCESKSDIV